MEPEKAELLKVKTDDCECEKGLECTEKEQDDDRPKLSPSEMNLGLY